MKLTPAEEWADKLLNLEISEREAEIQCVRQIQANAIRACLERLNSDPDIAFSLNWMEDQANQLDPLPETHTGGALIAQKCPSEPS